RTAAGEAFDELDGILSIGRYRDRVAVTRVVHSVRSAVRRDGMRVFFVAVTRPVVLGLPLFDVDSRGAGDGVAQLVGTCKLARQRAAHAEVTRPSGDAPKHRIERNELEDVYRLQLELRCDPLDGLVTDEPEVFLPEMEQWESRRSLRDGVMRNRFVNLGDQVGRDG